MGKAAGQQCPAMEIFKRLTALFRAFFVGPRSGTTWYRLEIPPVGLGVLAALSKIAGGTDNVEKPVRRGPPSILELGR